jgi:hypothetical protein
LRNSKSFQRARRTYEKKAKTAETIRTVKTTIKFAGRTRPNSTDYRHTITKKSDKPFEETRAGRPKDDLFSTPPPEEWCAAFIGSCARRRSFRRRGRECRRNEI